MTFELSGAAGVIRILLTWITESEEALALKGKVSVVGIWGQHLGFEVYGGFKNGSGIFRAFPFGGFWG